MGLIAAAITVDLPGMALPALAKTWQYSVNIDLNTTGTLLGDNRQFLRRMKNELKAFGTLPWTCSGSSNSVAAGLDGNDRWAADTDLVWANPGTVHSWIVLRQTGIATNYEICIDLSVTGSATQITFVVSPSAAFTGGTTSARPTATDEIVVLSNAAYHGVSTTFDCALHLMQSTDGQCTRIMMLIGGGRCDMFIMLDKPKNPTTGWTNPSIAAWHNAGAAAQTLAFTVFTNTARLNSRFSGTNFTNFITTEGYNANALVNKQVAPNDISGEYPMCPIAIASETATRRGRHGEIFDLYYGLEAVADGDTYPNDVTRQFLQIGEFIFPWNGTVPLLT